MNEMLIAGIAIATIVVLAAALYAPVMFEYLWIARHQRAMRTVEHYRQRFADGAALFGPTAAADDDSRRSGISSGN